MKIIGYEKTDDGRLLEMQEVTICTTPEALREIAKFIQNAADELEAAGKDFDHTHLRGKWKAWDSSGEDLIIGQYKI